MDPVIEAQNNQIQNIEEHGLAFLNFSSIALTYTLIHPIMVNQVLLQGETMLPVLKQEGIRFNHSFFKCFDHT